jgi:hypothetical protein
MTKPIAQKSEDILMSVSPTTGLPLSFGEKCRTCVLFDPDVLTAAIHLQQLKREKFSFGHVEIHFGAEGMINTNAIFDVSRRKRDK